MKYENRKQRREVSEFMSAILVPLKYYLKEEEQELLEVALRIINNTEVEDNERY